MDQARHRGGRTLLEDLGLELIAVAAMVAEIAGRGACPEPVERADRRESAADPAAAAETALRRVEAAIAARRARSVVFGLDLDNPGWSLMLELYRARLEARAPTAARLATDARISMATLARWRRRLVAGGWARRSAAKGARLALTDSAAESMAAYFATLALGFDELRFHRG